MSDCLFCDIVKWKIPSEKVLESDNFIVIKDVNPKVEGHSLVIPKEHYANFMEMPQELYEDFLKTTKDAVEKLGAKDFNFIMNNGKVSGQEVSHAHLHILPRKRGDSPVEGNHLTLV